jgi:hypothetical protein
MQDNLTELNELRKKIFQEKKYLNFEHTINKMMIPQVFDLNNCIPEVFSDKNYDSINKFECGEYLELYKKIKEDIIDLPTDDNPVIVVHPFYPIIRHANFLASDIEYLNTYIAYEQKMIKLLKKSKQDIILFESPDSFARYTYSFLKYNRIKKVILTYHSQGKVLNKNDLNSLNITKAKIAGCYGKHCISDVEKELSGIKTTRIDGLIMERFK